MKGIWYAGLAIVAFATALGLMLAAFKVDSVPYGIMAIGSLAISYFAVCKADKYK